MSQAFALIRRFAQETAGLSLDEDKRYLVEDRLAPVLRRERVATLDALAEAITREPCSDLARATAEALTINETSFFRDKAFFECFAQSILPALLAARAERRRLRFWCAGCSSGQEPYSIAMLLDEQARRLAGWQVEILATDLSHAMIDTARRGIYSQFEVQRGVPIALLLRYFRREGDFWHIADHLRAKVTFRPQNLVTGFRDLGAFDVVFCRNVLIYFDVATKRRVLANLAGSLAPDGCLALGAAESVGGLSDTLAPVPGQRFLFRKAGASAAADKLAVL
jgi:chemotaxis protein methyltransferase CheR